MLLLLSPRAASRETSRAARPAVRAIIEQKPDRRGNPASKPIGAPPPGLSACDLQERLVRRSQASQAAKSRAADHVMCTKLSRERPARAVVASFLSSWWWTIVCHACQVRRVLP